MRFTWTSSGDMKTLIRRKRSPGTEATAWSSAIATTLPSAGETSVSVPSGGSRSGSRKNQAESRVRTRRTRPIHQKPSRFATSAAPPRPKTMGRPSVANFMERWSPSGRRAGTRARRTPPRSVAGAVDEPLRGEPGHQAAQAGADLLDRVAPCLLPELLEVRQAAAELGDPLVGELTGLDVAEDALHRLPHFRANDLLAASHVPVLGR